MAAWAFVVTAVLAIGVGATWTYLNLGVTPPYLDGLKYQWFADSLTVDHAHGPLYPLVLSLMNPWKGEMMNPWRVNLVRLQLFQLGVLALCLVYFVYALRAASFARNAFGGPGARWALLTLTALLLFDPLLAHFALSVMPDSLALSGCLAFAATLAELVRDRARPRVVPALGFAGLAGFLLAAGVRVEKSWVLLLTLLVTMLLWFLLARGFVFVSGARLRARAAGMLAVGLLGFGSIQWLHSSMYQAPPETEAFRFSHWPSLTTVLHQRIIFPNLTRVYEQLSPASRVLLTREDARAYDRKIHNTWEVTDRVTRKDPEIRDRLTRDLASTAFRSRWPSLALDVASDTAENLLAPLSFYLRLASWSIRGADENAWEERFEATPWTYHVLAFHHPRISLVYLALSSFLFLFGCFLALLHARASFRAGSWKPTRQTALSLVPVIMLCAVNALAFSTSANLVHPRYTLFAHTAGSLLVYRAALAWVFLTLGARRPES